MYSAEDLVREFLLNSPQQRLLLNIAGVGLLQCARRLGLLVCTLSMVRLSVEILVE